MRKEAALRFPQHYAAASLKPFILPTPRTIVKGFSAALRCGLIEAAHGTTATGVLPRFPQHYAAASLKRMGDLGIVGLITGFPQHYAAASLKRPSPYL